MSGPGVPETCGLCGTVVIVAITQANGRRMPVERFPTDDGTVELVPAAYGLPVAVVHGKPGEPGEVRYRVHFPKCRQIRESRGRRVPKRRRR